MRELPHWSIPTAHLTRQKPDEVMFYFAPVVLDETARRFLKASSTLPGSTAVSLGLMVLKYGALKQTMRLMSQRPNGEPPKRFQRPISGLFEGLYVTCHPDLDAVPTVDPGLLYGPPESRKIFLILIGKRS